MTLVTKMLNARRGSDTSSKLRRATVKNIITMNKFFRSGGSDEERIG
jgi:hypothetical protein